MDVPLSLTRAELATLCEEELGKIKSLVRGCLEDAATEAGALAGAQAFGGGCRMPIVQDAVRDEVKWPGKLLFGRQTPAALRRRRCKAFAAFPPPGVLTDLADALASGPSCCRWWGGGTFAFGELLVGSCPLGSDHPLDFPKHVV